MACSSFSALTNTSNSLHFQVESRLSSAYENVKERNYISESIYAKTVDVAMFGVRGFCEVEVCGSLQKTMTSLEGTIKLSRKMVK